MKSPTEKQILNRAYDIRERNGRPEGREDEFWHQAEQELRAEEKRAVLRKVRPTTFRPARLMQPANRAHGDRR